MGKRHNGEGTVYKRADGSWAAQLSYLDPVTGQRKRRSFYGRTKAVVMGKLKEARQRLDSGSPVSDATITVGQWLRRWRETTLAASSRSEATKAQYTHLAKRTESGDFGSITLNRLKPTDVEALILDLRAKELSDSTIRSTFGVLRTALDVAVRDGLLATNPAAQVKRPGIERQRSAYLSADQVRSLLSAADERGLRYATALRLIAATGLRRGEALGLKWSDVDLDAGVLRVERTVSRVGKSVVSSTPKTARSRRTVPLSPSVTAMLKAHRVKQDAERAAAEQHGLWRDEDLVFCTHFGGVVEPSSLLREVRLAADEVGLPKNTGVHDLRHAAATLMLESGIHIKAVADILGHSSVSITGDIYAATSDDMAQKAVDALSDALS